MLSQPDKTIKESNHFVPEQGQWVSLSGDIDSFHCPFLGEELSKETLATAREIGVILEKAHKRLEQEGVKVPQIYYER